MTQLLKSNVTKIFRGTFLHKGKRKVKALYGVSTLGIIPAGVCIVGLGGPVGTHSPHKHAKSIMNLDDTLTLEHIDPRNHALVSGLRNDFNEVVAAASYNYSKSDYFLPYRIQSYPAPENPGDIGEFLIQNEWVVTEFMGEWYIHEAQKYSKRMTGLKHYKHDNTLMWEDRIKNFEERTNSLVIACSWDGKLSKNMQVRRHCEHGLSKTLTLWAAVKGDNCCLIPHNRKWASIASAYRSRKPLN